MFAKRRSMHFWQDLLSCWSVTDSQKSPECVCSYIYIYDWTDTFWRWCVSAFSLTETAVRPCCETGTRTQKAEPRRLALLLLFIVVLVVAVSDLLGSLGEHVGRFDLAEGAGQLGAFALQVLAVSAVGAVPCGQRGLHVYVHVGVLDRWLVGHLFRKRRGKKTLMMLRIVCDDYIISSWLLTAPNVQFSDEWNRASLGPSELSWSRLLPWSRLAPGSKFAQITGRRANIHFPFCVILCRHFLRLLRLKRF